VLPTGLGKTIIAAMVAAARLAQYPGSKVLFLAPTRPLSVQHHRTFSGILNIEDMIVLTGMDAVIKRKDLWENNRIIFATPQTIENDINRGLELKDVSLIIVDECHRTVGNYSYVHIAEEYMKKAANPLILGLTASPSSDSETVKEICKNLFIEQVEARTEDDADVAPYIQQVRTEWVKVDLPEEFRKAQKLLADVLRDDLKELKNKGYLESASVEKINRRTLLELQGKIREDITAGEDVFLYASLAASAIKVSHALELLETQGIWALDSYLTRLRKQQSKAIKRLFSDVRMNYLSDLVREMKAAGIDHPKLTELVRIVSAHKDEKVLIFTQYRDTVDRIIEKLNEADILAREFVGQATKDGKKGMSQKEQVEALENFKAGKYTALCATSVAEEGIDIPKVDVVMFYEPIPSEIRSIQRRGRTGRSAAGRVYVLMAKGTRDEAYYWASVHKERKMKTLVKNLGDRFVGDVGQQSLIKYSAAQASAEQKPEERKPKIFVDTRERSTEILKVLKEKADIEIRQLAVGDFILSERVGVERKTKEDFLSSLIDKRLMTQANELARNFAVPVMIIEGRGDLYSLRDIHANAIRGAIISLSLSFGINIIHSHDENDTANMLYIIAKREQLPEDKEVALRGERKPLDLMGRQRFIIESLPDVSAVLARRLLERFGSVQNIMNATENELLAVEGIGEKKAAKIRETIKSMYMK
jgi:ERCC4-related helicase